MDLFAPPSLEEVRLRKENQIRNCKHDWCIMIDLNTKCPYVGCWLYHVEKGSEVRSGKLGFPIHFIR